MPLLLICFLFMLALASAKVISNTDPSALCCVTRRMYVQGNNDGKGNLKPSQCAGECRRRCSKTHHKKPCLFFCNKCCAKCLCVPPGTYGSKETCPCYNNWKTKKGGPKCP
nr:unnamed protein product [Digitaria exilis]